jgi:hypothetical protein
MAVDVKFLRQLIRQWEKRGPRFRARARELRAVIKDYAFYYE